MANTTTYINKLVIPNGSDTITANLVDTVSGYTKNLGTVTDVTASGVLTSSGGTTPNITHNAPSTSPAKSTQALYPIKIDSYGHITEAGTAVTPVTSVTASGALTSSGGTTPAITHNAPATSPAKTTSAVYPITIDSYGHITAAGSAVTIPTESTVSGWGFTKNAGTVTSVTASGALTSSGGTTPAITHNKPSTSPAKTTQALYPIKIDEYGHITAVGTAVTSLAPTSHSHGDINNAGTITSTAVTPANGDYILITDANATTNHTIKRGIAIGTGTSKYLREDGTWQSVSTSDVKQNVTLATTTKAYLTAVTTAPTSTAQALEAYGDTGVYLTTEAGQINATSYKVNENAIIEWNDEDNSIDFVFTNIALS